jgi:hypothetical protein
MPIARQDVRPIASASAYQQVEVAISVEITHREEIGRFRYIKGAGTGKERGREMALSNARQNLRLPRSKSLLVAQVEDSNAVP